MIDVDGMVGGLVQLVQYAHFTACLCSSSKYGIPEMVFRHHLTTTESKQDTPWLNLLKGYPYDGYVEFNDNNGNTTWSFYSYEIDDWAGRIIKVKPDSDEVEYLSWFN